MSTRQHRGEFRRRSKWNKYRPPRVYRVGNIEAMLRYWVLSVSG